MTHYASSVRWLWIATLGVTAVMGCRKESRPTPAEQEIPPREGLCPTKDSDDFCMPAARLEQDLEERELQVLTGHRTAQGSSAPFKLGVSVTNDGESTTYHVKLKPVPNSFDEPNNSPRRELAAYALQKLFLDEERYVVPPTALRCLPRQGPLATSASHPGTDCVLGVVSYWVQNVRELADTDLENLASAPERAERLGDLNVLTYLEGHRDDVGLNFLVATDDDDPRALSIDNGIAFEMWKYNPIRLFTSSWSQLKVPMIRAATIARLRALDRTAIDSLATVAQLTIADGKVRIDETTAPFDPRAGVRRRGSTIQLGLTRDEIGAVHDHIGQLLREVDDGDVVLTAPTSLSRVAP